MSELKTQYGCGAEGTEPVRIERAATRTESRPSRAVMSERSLPFHDETTALAHAPIDTVFAYLDDPTSLAAHMGRSSMMMMGSKMAIEVDAGGGHAIGSTIRMHGRLMGLSVSLEEVITEREAPHRKLWETIGTPQLLVIAHYRMGFELAPRGDSSLVRVFIDYGLPTTAPGSWLGRLFGGAYARWCTEQMAEGAARHFDPSSAAICR